jgi:hypothetical protein
MSIKDCVKEILLIEEGLAELVSKKQDLHRRRKELEEQILTTELQSENDKIAVEIDDEMYLLMQIWHSNDSIKIEKIARA